MNEIYKDPPPLTLLFEAKATMAIIARTSVIDAFTVNEKLILHKIQKDRLVALLHHALPINEANLATVDLFGFAADHWGDCLHGPVLVLVDIGIDLVDVGSACRR